MTVHGTGCRPGWFQRRATEVQTFPGIRVGVAALAMVKKMLRDALVPLRPWVVPLCP